MTASNSSNLGALWTRFLTFARKIIVQVRAYDRDRLILVLTVALTVPLLLRDTVGRQGDDFNSTMTRGRRAAIEGAVLAAVALLTLPRIHTRDIAKDLPPLERFKMENDARQTVAQVVGGAIIALGAYHAWVQVGVQTYQAQQTLGVSLQGQIADRFTHALEKLADDKLEVRLGSMYALEQVVRDSPRDRWTVAELLSTYVRERTAWSDARAAQNDPRPSTDVQAVLTIIGRNEWAPPGKENDYKYRVDLSRLDLRGAELSGRYARVKFSNSHFEGAHIASAAFDGSDLEGAHFVRASIFSTSFQEARLNKADFSRAGFKIAQFIGAYMTEANFTEAQMLNIRFENASLVSSRLEHAPIHDCSFRGADVRGATFNDSWMTESDLTGIVGLTQAQLNELRSMGTTKLPPDMKQPSPRPAQPLTILPSLAPSGTPSSARP